jgi:hypothetical protein
MTVFADPRYEEWFCLGDITLCETCGQAIQYRRERIKGVGQVNIWVHFRPVSHFSEPAVSWREGAQRRDPV